MNCTGYTYCVIPIQCYTYTSYHVYSCDMTILCVILFGYYRFIFFNDRSTSWMFKYYICFVIVVHFLLFVLYDFLLYLQHLYMCCTYINNKNEVCDHINITTITDIKYKYYYVLYTNVVIKYTWCKLVFVNFEVTELDIIVR